MASQAAGSHVRWMEKRYLSGGGRYPQTSGFTCGAATLLNIAFDLGAAVELSPEAEYAIWRQANSVWMGGGHPGIEPWALALAGVRLGLGAVLHQTGMSQVFDGWNRNPEKREVASIVRKADMAALAATGTEDRKFSFDGSGMRCLVRDGARLAVLVGNSRDLHWVAVLGGSDGFAHVHDPYRAGSLDDLRNPWSEAPVTWENLRRSMALNSKEAACMVEFRMP